MRTKVNAGPRRIRVKESVYYRETPAGRRYEITYVGSDGKRRWQTIPGHDNLKQAEAQLVEIRQKLHRGEKVAPTKLTFNELADEYESKEKRHLRPGTSSRYEQNLRVHLRPHFGKRRAHEITTDDVVTFISVLSEKTDARKNGAPKLKGWTQRNVLTTLSAVYSFGVRRGYVPTNPVRGLARRERPKVTKTDQRVLEREEADRLLAAATDRYRPVLKTALFTGLRLGELLGLRCRDIDFGVGVIHVRSQLSRDGRLDAFPKTDNSYRDVFMEDSLARMLKEHRLASAYSSGDDYVFTTATGQPMNHRNVQKRGMDAAAANAGLANSRRKPTMHDCRHTFASMLIASGLDVVLVARQLGDSVKTVSETYLHLFDKANHAAKVRNAVASGLGNGLETAARNETQHANVKVLQTADSRN